VWVSFCYYPEVSMMSEFLNTSTGFVYEFYLSGAFTCSIANVPLLFDGLARWIAAVTPTRGWTSRLTLSDYLLSSLIAIRWNFSWFFLFMSCQVVNACSLLLPPRLKCIYFGNFTDLGEFYWRWEDCSSTLTFFWSIENAWGVPYGDYCTNSLGSLILKWRLLSSLSAL